MSYDGILANGLSTDHPHPDRVFVDDTHLPLHDPRALVAYGQLHHGPDRGGWMLCPRGGWSAYTCTPRREDVAWLVRHDPEHGTSVHLCLASRARYLYASPLSTGVLVRSGDYVWTGGQWRRPWQPVHDTPESPGPGIVPQAREVSAREILDYIGMEGRAAPVVEEAAFTPWGPVPREWPSHLRTWVRLRASTRPLGRCVVNVAAPELGEASLLGVMDLPRILGLRVTTIRSRGLHRPRGEPLPQQRVGRRSRWSVPVVGDWVASREVLWGPQGPQGRQSLPSTPYEQG